MLELEKSYLYPTCGGHSLLTKQMVNFELGRDLAVCEFYINIKAYMKSPDDH